MDSREAELLMTVPLETDEQVLAWFELLQLAHDAHDADLAEFADAVRSAAAWCDPNATEQFLRTVSDANAGLEPVAELLRSRPEMPARYWELYQQWYGRPEVEAEPDSDRFDWVHPDQASALSAAWGADWRDHLGPQLDYRWGADWEGQPAEHKQHWRVDVLAELLAPATEEAPVEQPESQPEVDLDRLAAQLVAETIAELDAEPLSAEELAEATAAVRRNLQEAANRE